MTLENKERLLMKKKTLFVCFKPNHIYKNCKFESICIKWEKKSHHFLICPDDNIKNSNDKNKNEIPETNIMTHHFNIENTYLMTSMFKAKNKSKHKKSPCCLFWFSKQPY